MKGTRGRETDHHEEFKITHFSRTDTVLTATFLSVHMPLSARVSRRVIQSRIHVLECRRVKPWWATSSSSSILRYQRPAARQSARWYAGFSQHIFAPLYRSIFWEEKYLRQEILNSRAGSHVTRNKTLPSWPIWCEHLGAGGYCRGKGAIFCVFMGIFVCVSRCLQSRCSARERLHDLFLFSGTTLTPRLACFPLIYPLPPPSARLPHLFSLTPRQLTPFLLCSLPSLDSSSRYRSAAFPPYACMLISHYLYCHATPWPEEGQSAPLNHRHPPPSLATLLTGTNSFLSDWRPHARLIFRSLFVMSGSSGAESH